jgi:N-acetylmuramoyl-L-alanine amidase
MKLIITITTILLSVTSIIGYAKNYNDDDKKNQKQTLKRIVIDPGHGGNPRPSEGNYGASSKYIDEKDAALAVSFKLKKVLNDLLPEIEVVLTREIDVFDNVKIKANKAKNAKGDLFISLHCNDVGPNKHTEITGYKNVTTKKKGKKTTKKVPIYHTYYTPSTAHGTETYIWGIGKNDEKEEAIGEANITDSSIAENFDPNDPAQKVAISLRMEKYAERSRLLAAIVEEEFAKQGRVSRGVKQRDDKGIWVLQAVPMPAILVEMGFLSYDEEGQYIASDQGQQEIAEAIGRAVQRYKFSLDNKAGSTKSSNK